MARSTALLIASCLLAGCAGGTPEPAAKVARGGLPFLAEGNSDPRGQERD